MIRLVLTLLLRNLTRRKNDDMTKMIEDLAREYYLNEVVNGDTCDDKDGWADCFVSGAGALVQLPVASRLTAEEKERVRKEYANTYPNDIDCGVENMLIQDILERIFGADFFKEGE